MKLLKYAIAGGICLLGSVAVASSATSEQAPAPVAKTQTSDSIDVVEKRLESMTKRLGLTLEQQAAMRPLLVEEAAKLTGLRDDRQIPAAEKKAKMLEFREASQAQFRSILNPEQQEKFDAWLQKRSEERKRK